MMGGQGVRGVRRIHTLHPRMLTQAHTHTHTQTATQFNILTITDSEHYLTTGNEKRVTTKANFA